jgi:hypothetical protein
MRAILFGIAIAISTPAVADVEHVGPIEGLGEVFFEFDSARVELQATALDRMAAYAASHPNLTIVLDGHADPRGATTYNVALAARRADAVRQKLVGRGVDADRIVIVTYGEDGLRRTSFDMDRRVTAWATTAPIYAIVEKSLDRGTAVLWSKPVPETALLAPRATRVAIP